MIKVEEYEVILHKCCLFKISVTNIAERKLQSMSYQILLLVRTTWAVEIQFMIYCGCEQHHSII